MAKCHAFLEQTRQGTPWVVQHLHNNYVPMPSDPASFSFWMALVRPLLPLRFAFFSLLLYQQQTWKDFYIDADSTYRALVVGCALSGPSGCPIASANITTPEEVDAEVQRVLKAAHDATLRNASAGVPITSGQIRCTSPSPSFSSIVCDRR